MSRFKNREEYLEWKETTNKSAEEVNSALRTFAWYYASLASLIILTVIVGIYQSHNNTAGPVGLFVLLLIAVFAVGHIAAMHDMLSFVNKARKAMNMNDISGVGCLLYIVSFFVLAFPLHILAIVHIFRLLNYRRKL